MLIVTFLPISLLDCMVSLPCLLSLPYFRYSRIGISCNSLSEGLKMLATRQSPSLSTLHALVAGKPTSGTGLRLEYMQCSFSSSPVSEFWTGHIVLHSGLFVVPCVPRFTLPENVVLKCFGGLDLSKMDNVYLKKLSCGPATRHRNWDEYISFHFYFVLFFYFHSNCFVIFDFPD